MTLQSSSPSSSAEALILGAVAHLRESGDPQLHRLKRGTELLDAMLEPIFVRLKQKLHAHRFFVSDDLLACALLLAARLQPGAAGGSFGAQLQKARFSEIRFASLVRCEEPAELFTHLQRAVRFCKDRAEPFGLLRLILGWHDPIIDATRKRLIAQYYSVN